MATERVTKAGDYLRTGGGAIGVSKTGGYLRTGGGALAATKVGIYLRTIPPEEAQVTLGGIYLRTEAARNLGAVQRKKRRKRRVAVLARRRRF